MEEAEKAGRPEEGRRKRAPKSGVLLKKMDLDTAKLFNDFKDRVNKKEFGKSVTDTDVLAIAVRLLGAEHIKPLQEKTYSETDKLHLAHLEFQRANGKIGLDQFIGKLLKGEIQPKN